MGTPEDPTLIRLRVPAQAEFVAVLRVAARAVAGRAGCDDDGRSRFQAAVGRAFFAAVDGASVGDHVTVALNVLPQRVQAELTPPHGGGSRLRGLADLADGHELVEGDGSVRIWVGR